MAMQLYIVSGGADSRFTSYSRKRVGRDNVDEVVNVFERGIELAALIGEERLALGTLADDTTFPYAGNRVGQPPYQGCEGRDRAGEERGCQAEKGGEAALCDGLRIEEAVFALESIVHLLWSRHCLLAAIAPMRCFQYQTYVALLLPVHEVWHPRNQYDPPEHSENKV